MDLSFLEQLAEEELRFKKFSLVGTSNVQAAGSLKAGYAVNINAGAEEESTGNPTGACCDGDACSQTTYQDCIDGGGVWKGLNVLCDPNPCSEATGACCNDFNCTIETESDCTDAGGTYQGDGTPCGADTCGPTGACCHGDGSCSIETEAGCDGVYQGDDSVCADIDCTVGACCVAGVCSQTSEEGCAGTFQGLGVPCTPDPCIVCRGCAFLNPADGRYYHVYKRFSHAEYHNHTTPPFIDIISDTVKVRRCTGDGIDCSESFGSGTFDYDAPAIAYHCHGVDTYFCNDPIEAFGFYGLNGLTFTEVCDTIPPGDPECCSGVIPSCSFGECTETAHEVYSEPCIPT